ncbi:MAG: hypothetical protein JXR76_13140 [Deltaproteobacteria bacterium]|nr:hypothetical protein [Deltaproteobacteria bacterium]
MTEKAFDAAGYIQINLKSGTIQNRMEKNMALIPLELFKAIPASEDVRSMAWGWGKERGSVFKDTMDIAQISMDVLSEHMQGEIALIGAGSTEIDVYGDAFMLQITGNTFMPDSFGFMLEGYVAGYISAVSSAHFDAVSKPDASNRLTIFLGNSEAVKKVKELLQKKATIADAVAQLHREVAK